MSIPQAIQEAYARAGSTTTHKIALKMEHALWGQPLYFVNYTVDLVVDSQVYVAVGMEVQEPEIGIEPTGEMTLRMDGLTSGLHALFNAAVTSATPISATIYSFALDTVDDTVLEVFNTYALQVKQVGISDDIVEVLLGRSSPAAMKFPRERYTPDKYPLLFS